MVRFCVISIKFIFRNNFEKTTTGSSKRGFELVSVKPRTEITKATKSKCSCYFLSAHSLVGPKPRPKFVDQ